MGSYRFVTTWRIAAARDRVAAVLTDVQAYPRWWPGIEEVVGHARGAGLGVGRVTVRGRLPYRLHLSITGHEARRGRELVVDATGDLVGSGRWHLHEDAGVTTATYTWQVATTKPWMRLVEPVVRPLFVWNHHELMLRGADGLAAALGSRLVDARCEPRVRLLDWAPAVAALGLVAVAVTRAVGRDRGSAAGRGHASAGFGG